MIKAIIIDDIEQARITLKKDLQAYAKDVEVIGEANGVIEGAKLLKSVKPDVLFLDIQMQDGSGFDLLDILKEINFKIIFITASDAHAIKAFRYAAIDYLLKPVDPDELVAALKKLREENINESEKYKLLNDSLKNHQKPHERLALHTQDKIHVVNIQDIIRCESNVNYTEFYFSGGKKLLVTKTLKDFEDLLSDQGFYRVHQSHLINTKYIKEFVKTDGGYILMNDGCNVPVSTRKRTEVMKMLEEL
ncbi:MAG TPA: LytTR family DNA-binding domain-containing protein [Bacteroidia bacterium]|jgi:two-component system LytT family response regulator|nr:LytTR family DNA-binding domain-containing protein [Bacteroidia bacterium]